MGKDNNKDNRVNIGIDGDIDYRTRAGKDSNRDNRANISKDIDIDSRTSIYKDSNIANNNGISTYKLFFKGIKARN